MFTVITAIFAMAGVGLLSFLIGGFIFESFDWGDSEDFAIGLILTVCLILSVAYSVSVMVYL